MPNKPKMPTKRRKMTKFGIGELSGVGSPAQEPALVTIIKAKEEPTVEKDDRVDKKKTITRTSTYSHQSSSDEKSKEVMDDDNEGRGEGTTILEVAVKEQAGTEAKKAEETEALAKDAQAKQEAMQKELDAAKVAKDTANAEKEALQKRLDRMETMAALTSVEKAHFETLGEGDPQDAFLKMNKTERGASIATAADENKVIFKSDDGIEYTGKDDPKVVDLAKKLQERDHKIAKLNGETAQQDLEKRAKDQLSHLPGNIDVHAALLKSAESIEDKDLREKALQALVSKNADMGDAFKRAGTSEDDLEKIGETPEAQIEVLAKKIAKEKNIPETEAYIEALESPEGQELYNGTAGRSTIVG